MDPRELGQCLRACLGGRAPAGRLLEHRPRLLGVGSRPVIVRRRKRSAVTPVRGGRRREPARTLAELRRRRSGAALHGARRGTLQGARHAFVGLVRGDREQAGALVLVRDDRGEPSVQQSPSHRIERLVCGGREKRMREPDAPAVELEDPCGKRGAQRLLSTGQPSRQSQGRMCQRRDRGQDLAGRVRQRGDPPGHELREALREARDEPLGQRRPLPVERPGDLERVERIAAGRGVDPPQHGQREHLADAVAQQTVQLADVQRPDGQAPNRSEAVEGARHGLAQAARQQHSDRLAAQAPPCERQHRRRGGIRALHVVDCQQHRARGRERSQRGHHRDAHAAFLERRTCRFQQQRRAQRLGLRRREVIGDLIHDVTEKIAQHGERQPHLGVYRLRGEHAPPALARQRDRPRPERGLARARLGPRARASPDHWRPSSTNASSSARSAALPTRPIVASRTVHASASAAGRSAPPGSGGGRPRRAGGRAS